MMATNTRWRFTVAAIVAGCGAAPAVAETGAVLGITISAPNTAPLAYSDFAGPIGLRQTGRTGSAQVTVDYGNNRVSATRRFVAVTDGITTARATVSGGWSDTVTVNLTGASQARLGFYIDVAVPSLAAAAAGFRNNSAFTTTEALIRLSTFVSGRPLSTEAVVQRRVQDTPITAPVTSGGNFAFNPVGLPVGEYNLFTTIASVAPARPGFERFLVSSLFQNGEYSLSGRLRCDMDALFFRIGDTATGRCDSALEWGGLASITSASGKILPGVTASAIGVSGFNYVDAFGTTGKDGFGSALAGTVPEPASWAMMILGFGMTGSALRSRRAIVA
jgi:PEP-CTERM motif